MPSKAQIRKKIDAGRAPMIKGLPSGPVDEVVWQMIWLMVALTVTDDGPGWTGWRSSNGPRAGTARDHAPPAARG